MIRILAALYLALSVAVPANATTIGDISASIFSATDPSNLAASEEIRASGIGNGFYLGHSTQAVSAEMSVFNGVGRFSLDSQLLTFRDLVADTISFVDGNLYLSALVDLRFIIGVENGPVADLSLLGLQYAPISRVGMLLTDLDPEATASGMVTSISRLITVDVDFAPAPVPLPASGLLLVSAFGLLAARRRRRKTA